MECPNAGLLKRAAEFITDRDPFGDHFSAHELAQLDPSGGYTETDGFPDGWNRTATSDTIPNVSPKERPDWPLPSFDAQDWAKAFCKIANDHGFKDAGGRQVDEGWMVTWFANSLMRGFDEHARRGS